MVLTRPLRLTAIALTLSACVDVRQRATLDVRIAPVPAQATLSGREITLTRAALHIADLRITDADPGDWGLEPPGGTVPLLGHAAELTAVDLLAEQAQFAGVMAWIGGDPGDASLRWAGEEALIVEGRVRPSPNPEPFALRLDLGHAVQGISADAPHAVEDDIHQLRLHLDLWAMLAAIPGGLEGPQPASGHDPAVRTLTSRPELWHLEWR